MNTETLESRKFKKDEQLPDGWVRGKCQNPEKRLEKKRKDEKNKAKKEKDKQEKIDLFTKMYKDYCKMPFAEVVAKYNYPYSKPNFVQMCQKYVKEFVPQNGKPRMKVAKTEHQ